MHPTLRPSSTRASVRQFWDAGARTPEDLVDGPLQHPAETAAAWGEMIAKLQADGAYKTAFERSQSHGPDAASGRDAVATFERCLSRPPESGPPPPVPVLTTGGAGGEGT